MANVEQWVSDRLHDVLGISDKYLTQYMIGHASKAKSAEAFIQTLRDTDTVAIDKDVIAFSEELWKKVKSILKLFIL